MKELPSLWQLRWDVASARALSWVADPSGTRERRPDFHLYLAERYELLARHHARLGHAKQASALRRKAEHHYGLGGPPDLPPAVAVAMSIPHVHVRVNAVSNVTQDPDDAA